MGRVVPNKRHDDLIRLASYWKRFISPDVRLAARGQAAPAARTYFDALQSLFYEEGFTPAEVVFTGHVDHDDLLACYAAAHVFVSMSEHEGFGVPLVESMLMRVPVPGLPLHRGARHPRRRGRAVRREAARRRWPRWPTSSPPTRALRAPVLAGQDRRLAAFAPAAVEGALRGYLEPSECRSR